MIIDEYSDMDSGGGSKGENAIVMSAPSQVSGYGALLKIPVKKGQILWEVSGYIPEFCDSEELTPTMQAYSVNVGTNIYLIPNGDPFFMINDCHMIHPIKNSCKVNWILSGLDNNKIQNWNPNNPKSFLFVIAAEDGSPGDELLADYGDASAYRSHSELMLGHNLRTGRDGSG